jgi:ribosome-binding factor A
MQHRRQSAPRSGRERSQRQLRVGEAIRHALAEVLARGEVHDPGLAGISVTVTEVRVSPDLRNATAFVLPLGGTNTGETLAALRRAAPFLRRRIGEALTLRHLPALGFEPDTGFDEGARVDRLLRSERVRRDLEKPADDDAGTGEDDPDGA